MNKNDYLILPFKQSRFCITDMSGVILDDSQGFGYKSEETAYNSMLVKFCSVSEKEIPTEWKYDNISFDTIKHKFGYLWSMNCGLYRSDRKEIDEIWNDVEDFYNLVIPDYVKNYIKKA